jgi:hypothetical protein
VNGDLSVRRPDASEIWRAASEPKNNFFLAFLSPDERRLAAAHASGNGADVVGKDGSRLVLTLWPVGWLDAATVIGTNDTGNLSFAALNAPRTIVDIGFQGKFLGTVHA